MTLFINFSLTLPLDHFFLPFLPPAAAAGGNKGKVKEKLMNNVMWDKATVDKLVKEIPKAKLITPATVSERLKVNASLAREAIKYLEDKGLIEVVGERHSQMAIFTRKVT